MLLALPVISEGGVEKASADDVHWEPAMTRVFIASLCWYKDKWHQAKVLETFDSLCLCRIHGKSSEYDEWFGPDRIRKGHPRKDKYSSCRRSPGCADPLRNPANEK